MNTPKAPHYFIGIDAGQQTGLAVWDVDGRMFAREHPDKPALLTTDFWSAYDLILTFEAGDVLIVLEDPSKNAPTFTHDVPRSERAARRREKISRNVGQNQREAQFLFEGLESRGYCVCRVRPRSQKFNAKLFKKITRYQGQTSQHVHDTSMLVFGLKAPPSESLGEATLGLYAPPPPPQKKIK